MRNWILMPVVCRGVIQGILVRSDVQVLRLTWGSEEVIEQFMTRLGQGHHNMCLGPSPIIIYRDHSWHIQRVPNLSLIYGFSKAAKSENVLEDSALSSVIADASKRTWILKVSTNISDVCGFYEHAILATLSPTLWCSASIFLFELWFGLPRVSQ